MVEITKTISKTVNVSINVKWLLSEAEPTTPPTGYVRETTLDIDLGVLGKLWAYIEE